ncbi:hypothetical protein Rsub_07260 [Raphidocelis subcapitata]|uniref:Uncharacterized protein n=1 Tax=Raphidocelis subcapitata TaxID=307507 RepID=A0A2V0P3K9_9CHLO|nr:hypothetical protein Rsub_07260 [Raphidocelis subcapitata]|eukprot:GBF94446.1 hypothetical protein Rsub_07260 [Raphidocelis subcapitata]
MLPLFAKQLAAAAEGRVPLLLLSAAPALASAGARGMSSAADPSGGGSPQQQQQQQQQQGAPPLSKAFVAGKLSQEELWMAGLPGKLKVWSARQRPELKGREGEVVDEVRSEFLRLMTAHATGRLLSHQTRRQLKLACLAAATHSVLMRETGGDAAAVEEHIAQSMGSLYAPFLLGSLKAVSWFKRALFNESAYKLALGTLHDIARDMEGGCECSVREDRPGAAAALDVSSCLFHEVLAAEGKPQLLKYLCCQHNSTWLDAYEAQGVAHDMEACRARGDGACRLTIRAAGGGAAGGG